MKVFLPPARNTKHSVRKGERAPVGTQPERHIRGLFDDPRLLQQVLGYLGPDDGSGGRELHLQVFAEAAGVVIDGCAGITEGLDERVDLQDLLTQRPVVGLRESSRTFLL